MIREQKIEQKCRVIGRAVTLSAAFHEDDRTGLKTPCVVGGCDSSDRCKARSEGGLNWSRCPYFGKPTKLSRQGVLA